MRLIFEREELEKLLDPRKRSAEEEKARKATLKAARELGKTLVIKPAPSYPAVAYD